MGGRCTQCQNAAEKGRRSTVYSPLTPLETCQNTYELIAPAHRAKTERDHIQGPRARQGGAQREGTRGDMEVRTRIAGTRVGGLPRSRGLMQMASVRACNGLAAVRHARGLKHMACFNASVARPPPAPPTAASRRVVGAPCVRRLRQRRHDRRLRAGVGLSGGDASRQSGEVGGQEGGAGGSRAIRRFHRLRSPLAGPPRPHLFTARGVKRRCSQLAARGSGGARRPVARQQTWPPP